MHDDIAMIFRYGIRFDKRFIGSLRKSIWDPMGQAGIK